MNSRAARFQVEFTVDGSGRARAEIKGVGDEVERSGRQAAAAGDEWEKFGEKLGRSMKWAGAAVVAGIGLIVHNTIQAEQEMAQLEAILKSTGNAAGMTRQELVGLADGLAKTSAFSTGDIIQAETRLLSYSGILGENIPRAMQAVIDQSARLGISVTQSAETIGRALESPSKAAAALAQQGFGAAFTKEVREQIKALEAAGREAEAQRIILGILEESYAGAAQAARDTFGGALSALKHALFDVITGGDGSLEGARQGVEDLIDTLNDPQVREGFGEIVSGATSAVTALIDFVTWSREAYSAAQEWLNLQLGGNRSMGGEHLAEQRRELEKINLELERRDAGGNPLPTALGLSSRSGLEQRRKQLQDTISMNEMLFGDPSTQRVHIIDPTDPASMQIKPPAPPASVPPPAALPKDGPKKLSDEARAAAQLEDRYSRLLEQYRQQIALNGDTSEAARVRYEIEQTGLAAINPGLAKSLQLAAEQRDAQRAAVEDERARQLAMEEGVRLTEALRTPQAELSASVARYSDLLARGAIDQQAYNRAVADAEAAYDAAEESARRNFPSMKMIMEDFSEGAQMRLGDDLYDVFSGNADRMEERWKALLTSLMAELIASKVFDYFNGTTGAAGAGEGGGFWASVGGWFSGMFGGAKASGGGVSGSRAYEVTEHGKPELFRNREGKTFLLPGQDGTVIPAQYAASSGAFAGGASAPPIVNLTINRGADEDRAEVKHAGNGGLDIEVWLRETLRGQVASGGLDGAMGARYGLRARGSSYG